MLTETKQTLRPEVIEALRCPKTGHPLRVATNTSTSLLETSEGMQYRLTDSGIPLFAESEISDQSLIQQQHYDKMADTYQENLSYPHTQEYLNYLDTELIESIKSVKPDLNLGCCVELCCGTGEAVRLLGYDMKPGIAVDISKSMLEKGHIDHHEKPVNFVQGDATNVPIRDNFADTVIMLGGIHHVPDRTQLFSEIQRILKPNGYFIYREPVSDFWLWRMIRHFIYRVSPLLSHDTERPLIYEETVPVIEKTGLKSLSWKTYGFFGFCLFMNSDVLWFNRFFRFIPGIRKLTQLSTKLDHWITCSKTFHKAGLQVIGIAQKPANEL